MALEPGDNAPDFELTSAGDESISLSDLLSSAEYAVLAFYPKAKTAVCGEEITLLDEFQDDLEALGARIAGISVDDVETLGEWVEETGFTMPLLSDTEPKGSVSEQYDVMSALGVSERAYFIIDSDEIIRYSYVSPMRKNPGVDRLFSALEEIDEESNSAS